MKKIKALREALLVQLDGEYASLREMLAAGYAPQAFNKKGQRSQSTILSALKVQVEEVQELNRIQARIKKGVVIDADA